MGGYFGSWSACRYVTPFGNCAAYPLIVTADFIILGGLSGRLDQTVHTLSYIHKLRKDNRRVFVVTDDNVGWVLKEVSDLICIYACSSSSDLGILRENTSFTSTITPWARPAVYYQ